MDDKSSKAQIPRPAAPLKRKSPLPWETPKPASEDPQSTDKLNAILTNSCHIPAIQDIDFLNSQNARGIRLQLDYLKPQEILKHYGIERAIVVFGSTRIVEPDSAQRKLDRLEQELAEHPKSSRLKRQIEVAKRILFKSKYYQVAREFAALVSRSGAGPEDHNLVIVTGGGPGIMEAANRGASESGAKTIGLNITLPNEQFPNPYISPEMCFQFHYFAIRKLHFVLRAKALVAFPGGYGTLDEVFETLTLIQTRKIAPIPVVFVGEEFWRQVVDIDFLAAEGMIDMEDKELFWFAETAEDIWYSLNQWYAQKGEHIDK
ncbi:LOG family protein [Aliiglaciecola sp. LCG003]|uniref:LOG family protein n=1 Tax=Aliiglaciecola sp. LCG003 TaxID=3053655 RepID=UPI0025735B22|nr:LOG family protein [Aliiglaciecola sp. LCG003]WJG07683.1 LOG family protein [Aliiglaciecola sp. LCG003]